MVRNVEPSVMEKFISSIFESVDVPKEDARLTSRILVQSDMMGVRTHGIYRVPMYIERIQHNLINIHPDIKTVKDTTSLAIVDGDNGLGQVVSSKALDLSLQKAKQNGISAVFVRGGNHFGPAGYYTRYGAMKGFMVLLFTNASGTMFPFGGNRKVVGNNPWSIAIPNGDTPVVLDISNSASSRGKVRQYLDREEEIPAGWALDINGKPTTDPQKAIEGSLQWIGGHKGYIISVMVDMLSSIVSGSASLTDISNPTVFEGIQNLGHLLIAIDPYKLIVKEEFDERIREYISRLKKEGTDGNGNVLFPGEPESISYRKCLEEGLDVDGIPGRALENLLRIAREREIKIPF